MLNQHYLDPMFSLSKSRKQAAKGEKGIQWKPERKNVVHNEDKQDFLDRIVTPDERLATRRDSTAVAKLDVARRDSGLEFGSGQILKDTSGPAIGKDAEGDSCLTFTRTASDRVVAEKAVGKTVKELSRLWKYLGGKSPIDHEQNDAKHHDDHPHEHRKDRHDHWDQRKAEQNSGDEPVLEQQKSPFPHLSPTTEEHFFHVSNFFEPFCLARHLQ